MYYKKYIETSKVYIPWDGYNTDLSVCKIKSDFRDLVIKEKGINKRTSAPNWAGQLYSFVKDIKIGDYVLIPSKGSRTYCLALVNGDYCYDQSEEDKLYHSRSVELIEKDIPRTIFTQSIIYSLGTYRTIFRA